MKSPRSLRASMSLLNFIRLLRLIKRRANTFGMATPRAIQKIIIEADTPLTTAALIVWLRVSWSTGTWINE